MRYLAFLLLVFSSYGWAESAVEPDNGAECLAPELLLLPDGYKASESEMRESRQQVQRYIQDTQIFLDCLLAAEEMLGEALTFTQKQQSINRYNLAVARLEGVVDSFNQQLRAFNSAQTD